MPKRNHGLDWIVFCDWTKINWCSISAFSFWGKQNKPPQIPDWGRCSRSHTWLSWYRITNHVSFYWFLFLWLFAGKSSCLSSFLASHAFNWAQSTFRLATVQTIAPISIIALDCTYRHLAFGVCASACSQSWFLTRCFLSRPITIRIAWGSL